MRALASFVVLALVGCGGAPRAGDPSYPVGSLVEIRAFATSFNENPKTLVVTQRGTFTVIGGASGVKDGEAFVKGGYLFLPQANGESAGWRLSPRSQ